MDTAHNRQSVEHNTHFIVEHNTHFIVIAASLVCWVPSLVFYCIHFLSQEMFPNALAGLHFHRVASDKFTSQPYYI